MVRGSIPAEATQVRLQYVLTGSSDERQGLPVQYCKKKFYNSISLPVLFSKQEVNEHGGKFTKGL